MDGAPNPLMVPDEIQEITLDHEKLRGKVIFPYRSNYKRTLKTLHRRESAREALRELTPTQGIFGFTKGQFSLIELIEATLERVGPSHIFVSTWTATSADLAKILNFLDSKLLKSVSFLIDFTFQRRQPAVAHKIRTTFGRNSIRITRNHAKFFQIWNDRDWHLTCKTSMNLNQNPRFEDFDISNDLDLFEFLQNIRAEIFSRIPKEQVDLSTGILEKQFETYEENDED